MQIMTGVNITNLMLCNDDEEEEDAEMVSQDRATTATPQDVPAGILVTYFLWNLKTVAVPTEFY